MAESKVDQPRPLEWIGSSKKDLVALPDEVVDVFGFALHLAQIGRKHEQAKPLRRLKAAAKRAKELEDEQTQDANR